MKAYLISNYMKSELIYLLSNFILTSYGLLVKSYKGVELIEQVYLRTVVFTLLSAGFLRFQVYLSWNTLWLSLINFISIYGIYVAFEKLGLGITQALFYSWPLFFYILANQGFNWSDLAILATTFLFVFFIYKPIDNRASQREKMVGLLGVASSIITHVYILSYYTTNNPPISEYLYNQYAFIFVGLTLYYIWQYFYPLSSPTKENNRANGETKYKNFIAIVVFNLVLGYLGFYLQFLSVGALAPYIVGLLTFISIIISLFLDKAVFHQSITLEQWIGIIGILAMTTVFRKSPNT